MRTERGAVTVDRLRDGEFEQAVELLARAFADGEAIMGYMLEGRTTAQKEAWLRPLFRGMIRTFAPSGHIHTARVDGTLVGVGIRVPPGKYPLTGMDQFRSMLRMLPMFPRVLPRKRTRTMLKILSIFEEAHPHDPHYYLMWVGVDPDVRRKGVAAALANEVIGLADEEGVGCYLETFGPHTRDLYQRRGFEVVKEIRPRPDGPQGWLLWRPAKGA